MVERIKTGIPGLDELIDGGVPKGFNVLIVGQPGAGKTILGLQYLYNGSIVGENGIYVALDSSEDVVRKQADQFGWNLSSLEKEGKLKLLKIPLDKPKVNLFDMLEEEVKELNAKRLVFDSLADFAINIDQFAIPLSFQGEETFGSEEERERIKKDKKYRYEVLPTLDQDPKGRAFYRGSSRMRISYLVINKLSMLGTTNLVITDSSEGERKTIDGISEFVCDGVLRLHAVEGEDLNTLNISKMRLTKPKRGIFNFSIGTNGISVSK